MHVHKCEFKAAVEWLSGRSFSRPTVTVGTQVETKEPKPLVMPAVNEKRWSAVQNYLVETRKLPLILVEKLHEKGLIYADNFQNAVFVRYAMAGGQWKRGEMAGASIRGTWQQQHPFKGMAPGTVRDKGWFWIGTGSGSIERVMLMESPIDAMSLAVLDRQNRSQNGVTVYISVDGAGAVPLDALKSVMQYGGKVQIAFDADKPGELMAWRLAQNLPRATRLLPTKGKDWNEQLTDTGESVLPRQKLLRLWKWHRAAFTIGHSEKYLNRIGTVATDWIKGEMLSARAKRAMAVDFRRVRRNLISEQDRYQ